MYDVERKIEVEWARTAEDAFPVRIVVHTDDRPGMLNQLTSLLSDENTNIRSLEAKAELGSGRRRGGNDRGRARQEAAREAGCRHAPHLRRARRRTALQLNMSLATDPEHIAISKSKGIKIDWKDGHRSEYALEYLRDKCPCAGCTGAHGTPPRHRAGSQLPNPFPIFKPALKMMAVEPVGNYAIRITGATGTTPASILTSISGASAHARNAGRYSGNWLRQPGNRSRAQRAFYRAATVRERWLYSSRKLTSMVASTVTGLPSFLPGRNFQLCTASMAFSSNPRPRLRTTFMLMAWPDGSICTYSTTVP